MNVGELREPLCLLCPPTQPAVWRPSVDSILVPGDARSFLLCSLQDQSDSSTLVNGLQTLRERQKQEKNRALQCGISVSLITDFLINKSICHVLFFQFCKQELSYLFESCCFSDTKNLLGSMTPIKS